MEASFVYKQSYAMKSFFVEKQTFAAKFFDPDAKHLPDLRRFLF